MKLSRAIFVFLGLALGGCAVPGQMLPGTLASQNGDVLDFQIEVASRSGAVTAYNPRTAESFSGKYVGILESVSVASSGFATSGRVSASSFGTASFGSNIANASAFLRGNKGSMLNCRMQIEAGLNPHGIGSCIDEKEKTFSLQF